MAAALLWAIKDSNGFQYAYKTCGGFEGELINHAKYMHKIIGNQQSKKTVKDSIFDK